MIVSRLGESLLVHMLTIQCTDGGCLGSKYLLVTLRRLWSTICRISQALHVPQGCVTRDPDKWTSSKLSSTGTNLNYQMICVGGTVGIGFARSSGEILAIAGPGGTLIAFVVVGVIAICVIKGICKMINLWPISNAMIEFVRAFVDEDLAIVVGFTYWYIVLNEERIQKCMTS